MKHAEPERRKDWHAAFDDAIRAELLPYAKVLTFEREHYLNTEPLRIDLLIIKKESEIKIHKNFAEDFLGHNIVEYKSPGDSLSMSDYLKVLGYACLYQALERVPLSDITITIVSTMRPNAVLKSLGGASYYKVVEKSSGIYKIEGEHFPVQIVASKELPEDQNLFLRSLRSGLTEPEALRLQEEALRIGPKLLQAFLYVMVHANRILYDKERYPMTAEKWTQLLTELGWTKMWIAEGKAEGKLSGHDDSLIIYKGLRNNVPLAKLAEETGTTLEEVERMSKVFLSV